MVDYVFYCTGDKKQASLEQKESSGGMLRAGSAKDKKPLEGVTTKFFVGTEVSFA